jgi:hypothetical protein
VITRSAPGTLLFSLLLAASTTAHAQAPAAPAPSLPELTVTVSESLDRRAEGFATFGAIQSVFTRVLNERHWPVKINVVRFAANNPDQGYELRVFFRGIYHETPDQLTIRAWMTLFDHGKEHDFGIIKSQLDRGTILYGNDAFEMLLAMEARAVAAKIGPILFPNPDGHKS